MTNGCTSLNNYGKNCLAKYLYLTKITLTQSERYYTCALTKTLSIPLCTVCYSDNLFWFIM